jgi:hypothetical protein
LRFAYYYNPQIESSPAHFSTPSNYSFLPHEDFLDNSCQKLREHLKEARICVELVIPPV